MNFSIQTMLAKVLKRAAVVAVAFVTSGPVASSLEGFGVSINPEVATVGVYGLLEAVRNFVKVKFNVKYL